MSLHIAKETYILHIHLYIYIYIYIYSHTYRSRLQKSPYFCRARLPQRPICLGSLKGERREDVREEGREGGGGREARTIFLTWLRGVVARAVSPTELAASTLVRGLQWVAIASAWKRGSVRGAACSNCRRERNGYLLCMYICIYMHICTKVVCMYTLACAYIYLYIYIYIYIYIHIW